MPRIRLAAFLPLLLLIFSTAICSAESADANRNDAERQQIEQWIAQLDDDDYAVRDNATRRLIEAGPTAIDSVAAAVLSRNPEISWRAASALESIGIAGDETTMLQVIKVMQQLSAQGMPSLASSSQQLSQRWRERRHERAATAIRGLGGQVVEAPGNQWIAVGGVGGFGGGEVIIGGGGVARFAIIAEELADDVEPAKGPAVPVGGVVELKILEDPDLEPADDAPPLAKPFDAIRLVEPAAPARRAVVEPRVELPKDDDIEHFRRITRELVEAAGRVDRVKADEFADEIADAKVIDAPIPIPVPVAPRAKPVPLPPADEAEVVEAVVEELVFDDVEVALDAMPVVEGFVLDAPAMLADSSLSMATVRTVQIDKTWKGGDEGLQYLKDLANTTTLTLTEFKVTDAALAHIAEMSQLQRLTLNQCSFDSDGLVQFKKDKPNVTVYASGKTILGVSGGNHPEGFQVNSVVSSSGAAEAGIQPGDVIQAVDDMRVTCLDELTFIVAAKEVGDTISVTLRRGEETLTVNAKLGPREFAPRD